MLKCIADKLLGRTIPGVSNKTKSKDVRKFKKAFLFKKINPEVILGAG
jgi:hypothetical protein